MAMDFSVRESSLIKDLYIIDVNSFDDERGSIWTIYNSDIVHDLGLPRLDFKLDKFTISHKNVLRGIHGDDKTWKLVTCAFGEILQVVVDCRKYSPSYLKYEKFLINKDNRKVILIPPSCGNGVHVRSDEALYYYKQAFDGEYTDADGQFTFAWNDPRIGIEWGVSNPVLSARDIDATINDHTKGH